MSFFDKNNRFSNTGGTGLSGPKTVEEIVREMLGMDYNPDIALNRVPVSLLPAENGKYPAASATAAPRFNSIREVADFFRRQALDEDAGGGQQPDSLAPATARSPFGSIRELAQAFRDGWRPGEPDSDITEQHNVTKTTPPYNHISQKQSFPFDLLGSVFGDTLLNSGKASANKDIKPRSTLTEPERDNIIEAAFSWEGVPYVGGGKTKTGVDCSNFVHIAYNNAGIPYEYTSTGGDWEKQGFRKVEIPQKGDLILWRRSDLHHVGIVVDPVNGTFIGSQNHGGVSVANYTKHYWRGYIFLRMYK